MKNTKDIDRLGDFLTANELELLIEYIPDFLTLIDPVDQRILYVNRTLEGLDKASIVGRNYFDYSPQEEREAHEQAFREVISQQVLRSYEMNSVIDGQQYWFLNRFVPVIREGKTFLVMALCTDISEQKNIIQALEMSQLQLSEHLSHTPLAAIVWDANQVTVEWNPAAERIFGWTREEAIGKEFTELIVPESEWESRRGQFHKALELGEIQKYPPYPNMTKDRKIITCEWFSTTLKNPQGEVIGIASLAQDVTDKLAAQEELKAAKLAAEASVKAKSQFLANMSHEIRTPMNGILGMIELMKMSELSEKQQGNLEVLHQSTQTLLAILNDILDYSKIEAGSIALESIPTDISQLLQQVYELMKPEALSKGLLFEMDELDGHVPEVKTDPNKVTQVISNLVSNAIKFTDEGQVKIELDVQRRDNKAEFIITIKDTGIGIEQEHLDIIFDDFSQADETITRRYGGTGLGLTISKKLAEMLGGDISVQSVPDEGTIFIFNLACELASAEEKQQMHAQDGLRQFKQTVLLVDDNEINLLVGRKLLETLGLTVLTATCGHEAIDAVNAYQEIALVLMDIHMPDMDGVEATREIKANTQRTLPVIAVTANVLNEEKDRCLKSGMDGFLGKPFSLRQMSEELVKWLD